MSSPIYVTETQLYLLKQNRPPHWTEDRFDDWVAESKIVVIEPLEKETIKGTIINGRFVRG